MNSKTNSRPIQAQHASQNTITLERAGAAAPELQSLSARAITVQFRPNAPLSAPRLTFPRRPTTHALPRALLTSSPSVRTFTSTPLLLKKLKSNTPKGRSPAPRDSQKTGTKESPEEFDASDFSTLHTGITKALDKLASDLSKLRTGGRFNPELLEALRVHLEKDSKTSHRMSELGQVLPKSGRSLMILVGEHAHVRPIMSAMQNSDLNLQPVQDPHNANQLNVALPAPTKESRDKALAAAQEAGEGAKSGITHARGVMQKRLRKMELERLALPDELKRAHKEMEKIVQEGTKEVKKVVDAARKAMEQAA